MSASRRDISELKREQLGTGVRGKYFQHFAHGSNVVVLRPEIQKAVPTFESVNNPLARILAFALETKNLPSPSKRAPRKRATV